MVGFVGIQARRRRRNRIFFIFVIIIIFVFIFYLPTLDFSTEDKVLPDEILPDTVDDKSSLISDIEELKLEVFSMESELFPQLVLKGNLYGKIIKTSFTDIGIPSDYYEFCKLKSK